jgi:hypothetical protein
MILLDGWWMADYAKGWCEQLNSLPRAGDVALTASQSACAVDPIPEERDFEDRLAARFAVDPQCSGAAFIIWGGPEDKRQGAVEAMQQRHWQLIIDFKPGAAKHSWSIKESASDGGLGNGAQTSGEGDATAIANMACAIVTKRGATLAQ